MAPEINLRILVRRYPYLVDKIISFINEAELIHLYQATLDLGPTVEAFLTYDQNTFDESIVGIDLDLFPLLEIPTIYFSRSLFLEIDEHYCRNFIDLQPRPNRLTRNPVNIMVAGHTSCESEDIKQLVSYLAKHVGESIATQTDFLFEWTYDIFGPNDEHLLHIKHDRRWFKEFTEPLVQRDIQNMYPCHYIIFLCRCDLDCGQGRFYWDVARGIFHRPFIPRLLHLVLERFPTNLRLPYQRIHCMRRHFNSLRRFSLANPAIRHPETDENVIAVSNMEQRITVFHVEYSEEANVYNLEVPSIYFTNKFYEVTRRNTSSSDDSESSMAT